MSHRPIPRRTFLRGVGTALALPLLESMLPAPVRAAALAGSATSSSAASGAVATSAAAPNRMIFMFVPNGMNMGSWTPATEGAGFELSPILQPLSRLRGDFSILSGLAQNNASDMGDGGGDHARSSAVWLTGVHPRKTDGADIQAGISVDQMAAQHIGKNTAFPSLEIGIERGSLAGNCDSGYSCAYQSSVSWRSENTPVAKEVNPRLVFERLFGNGEAAEEGASRYRRTVYRKSVLDLVMEDAGNLRKGLGNHDRRKLDEYLDGVREIELRLGRAEQTSAIGVGLSQMPGGIPQDVGEHIRLMGDMMVLALQADLTRVCTFMFANDGSNRNYTSIGISEGHHELSHHQGSAEKLAKVQQINLFHTTQLAYILERMKNTPEGDGNLLDHSMVVYGAGISDGDRHNHDNLPILLAGGGAGTLKPGQHQRFPDNTPMSNLFLSMLDRMNVPENKFGDSTGRLERLI